MEPTPQLPSTQTLSINQVRDQELTSYSDTLVVEEPLEIRLEFGPHEKRIKKTISITMRTPGHDFERAVGFLFTEGILRNRQDLQNVEFCGPSKNVVRVELKSEVTFDVKSLERHFYTSSSCGVCGKTSIEALRVQTNSQQKKTSKKEFKIRSSLIHGLSQKLRKAQTLFDSTGGIHGCAAFNAQGDLLASREDVGRHNALDKLIGFYFLNEKLPLDQEILLVSGRASFELVQKASMAGFKIFAAVGAPSSLAVELAKETEMTLLGFVRDERFNIYCRGERLNP
jgi:FdhD protein